MRTPDYVEPTVGWRAWLLVERDGQLRLQSLVYDAVWSPGEPMTAVCLRRRWRLLHRSRRGPPHPAPEIACSCGVYAAQPDWLRQYLRLPAGSYAFGRVRLWGSIVECEHGWRAQHAYPAQVYVPASAGRGRLAGQVIDGLADYGVPVEPIGDRITDRLLAAA